MLKYHQLYLTIMYNTYTCIIILGCEKIEVMIY